MRVCGPDSIEVAAYARCLAQMSEDYSRFLTPGLPRPFYMPNPVPLYRQTLNIIEKVIGPEDPSVSRTSPVSRIELGVAASSLTEISPRSPSPPDSREIILHLLVLTRPSVGELLAGGVRVG